MDFKGPSPVKLGQVQKSNHRCIICSAGTNLSSGQVSSLKIIKTAQLCQDDVFARLVELYGDNLGGQDLLYHRLCFQTYTSKTNIQHRISSQHDHEETIFHKTTECKRTRSSDPIFWSSCLICGFRKHKGDKKLHVIQSFERAEDILNAAQKLQDTTVLGRILGEDLIAKEGLYHETCVKRFLRLSLSANPVQSQVATQAGSKTTAAFRILTQEIQDKLFVEKRALGLTMLLDRYNQVVDKTGETSLTSAQLKIKLSNFYGERIAIQTLPARGNPNIIFSSSISLSDAIYAAQKLKEELTSSQSDDVLSHENYINDTLREAAAILRNDMTDLKTPDTYPSPADVGQTSSQKFVPSSLISFMTMLLDPQSFQSSEEDHEMNDVLKRKAVTLSECILHAAKNVVTPFHIGLAVQLHHAYGSKKLIDTLHSYGLCASYSELRLFLTSVAEDEINKIVDGVYVPHGLVPVSDGGGLIQEGDDNVDLNIETIDGKNTFHSMARVVFQMTKLDSESKLPSRSIKRGGNRSLPNNNPLTDTVRVLPYKKPSKRPEPPRHDQALEIIKYSMKPLSRANDVTWVLLRMLGRGVMKIPQFISTDCQTVPFWSGYNQLNSEINPSYTVASYAPLIDAKPSDLSTVYTAMVKCQEMSHVLGQKYSVQTMDLQLYAVAQNVKWNLKETFSSHVVRLGGFHEVQSFIAAIGRLWGDGGLLDLLVDSGVYASATAEQMLAGKQHHRAVRGITLTYEVLSQAFLTQFFKWCDNNSHGSVLEAVWQKVPNLDNGFGQCDVSSLQVSVDEVVMPLMNQFETLGRSKSPKFDYWATYLDAVQILLWNIRAERESDWEVHLATQGAMLPYIYAANRTYYARYIPVYILDMMNLPREVKDAFLQGQHTYREKPGKFNSLWTDMGVEKTVIRDSKSDGGVIGLTRRNSALLRWTVSRHLIGEYATVMQERSGVSGDTSTSHEEIHPSSLSRDERHLVAMSNHLSSGMTDPFDLEKHPDSLINISTGVFASSEVQHSLTNIVKVGKKKMEAFVKDTLSTTGQKSFYSPLPRSGLITFTEKKKKTKLLTEDGTVRLVHLSAEMVFRRALCLTACRDDVTMAKVLAHPIGPVPTSLFNEDGSMRKTTKADFTQKLEEMVESVDTLPDFDRKDTFYIRDAMALLRCMKPAITSTFDSVVDSYVQKMKQCFTRADTVIDVFDRYDNPNSTKSSERSRRGDLNTGKKYQVSSGRQIPQWNKFLGVSENKSQFNNFLCSKVQDTFPTDMEPQDRLYLSGGYKDGMVTKLITSSGHTSIEQLECSQEEADTRMLFHAMHCNDEFEERDTKGRIVIKSPETDVLVLCIYYFPQMEHVSELWFETGVSSAVRDRHRFIPVHNICHRLGSSMSFALPGIHAFTGCDTSSAFFHVGKKTVYKAMMKDGDLFSSAQVLSSGNIDAAVEICRKLTAALYDPRKKLKSCDSLNDMRFQLCRLSDIELAKLPPCEDSFQQHVKRVMWQTRIWTNSHCGKPELGNPENFGWTRLNGLLTPKMFENQTASEVLDCLVCTCCKSPCSSGRCICRQNNLPCIELCYCKHGQSGQNCTNPMNTDEDISDNEE